VGGTLRLEHNTLVGLVLENSLFKIKKETILIQSHSAMKGKFGRIFPNLWYNNDERFGIKTGIFFVFLPNFREIRANFRKKQEKQKIVA
jgi:hypothetical protein